MPLNKLMIVEILLRSHYELFLDTLQQYWWINTIFDTKKCINLLFSEYKTYFRWYSLFCFFMTRDSLLLSNFNLNYINDIVICYCLNQKHCRSCYSEITRIGPKYIYNWYYLFQIWREVVLCLRAGVMNK